MTNRTVLNSAELDEMMADEAKEIVYTGSRLSKKFKHTLESDEEDDEERAEKYNVLNPDEFEGHEEATIDHDGDIKITPFNMKEELEEGYFDKDGTYIFQKENDIKDQWLDDIDWVKVKHKDGINEKKRQLSESDSDDLPEINVTEHYRKMLDFMIAGETVQKAICRLGGNKSAKKGKHKKEDTNLSEAEKEKLQQDKEKLQELTGLASELLQNGDTDIYQTTFERLTFLVKSKESAQSYEANDDMFADDFEAKATTVPAKTEVESENLDSEVKWEFKWEDKEAASVYGPHSTSEMLNWTQEGYFAEGVYVRQVGKTDSRFYSSKRMDFELYL